MARAHSLQAVQCSVTLPDLLLQAAKILMLQREEKDPPSDFQDYTLLALVAVSAYLSNVNLGERNGLVRLGQRYNQDIEPLQQVRHISPPASERVLHEIFCPSYIGVRELQAKNAGKHEA